jgi:hypothetical protein
MVGNRTFAFPFSFLGLLAVIILGQLIFAIRQTRQFYFLKMTEFSPLSGSSNRVRGV